MVLLLELRVCVMEFGSYGGVIAIRGSSNTLFLEITGAWEFCHLNVHGLLLVETSAIISGPGRN